MDDCPLGLSPPHPTSIAHSCRARGMPWNSCRLRSVSAPEERRATSSLTVGFDALSLPYISAAVLLDRMDKPRPAGRKSAGSLWTPAGSWTPAGRPDSDQPSSQGIRNRSYAFRQRDRDSEAPAEPGLVGRAGGVRGDPHLHDIRSSEPRGPALAGAAILETLRGALPRVQIFPRLRRAWLDVAHTPDQP